MASLPLTRRSLMLRAMAGAAAAGLARPAGVLAAVSPPPPRLSSRWIGELPAGSVATVRLRRPVDLVGLEWQGAPAAGVQLRVSQPPGGWSPWVAAGGRGHGPEAAHGPSSVGEPIWTGGTVVVQVRSSTRLSDTRLHLVDVSGGVGARALAASPLARLASRSMALVPRDLATRPAQPPIVARGSWARGASPPRVAPGYGAVRMAFVHHTENPNGYTAAEVPAMLRAIYAFHRFVKGWNDIGYNFVVDLYGRAFEARAGGVEEPVVGAQAGGYNLVSTGIAVLGTFMSSPISPAALATLERLLAWKLTLHGVPASGRVVVRVDPAGASFSRFPAGAHVPLPRIAGHRDGDSTDCPGDVLYSQLPAIRRGVRARAPRPLRLTLAGIPAPAVPLAAVPPPPLVGGTLAYLDGTPLAAARVALQARTVRRRGELVREQTIGEALTDEQGRWSLAVSVPPPVTGPPPVPAPPPPAPAAPASPAASALHAASAPRRVALRAVYAGGAPSPGPAPPPGATVSEPLELAPAAAAPTPRPEAPPPTATAAPPLRP